MKLGYRIFLSNFNALKYPYKLTFAITYRCNSRCKLCNIWQKKHDDELSLEEIENFSKKSNFFSWINLTGGEPFLRNDIVSIVNNLIENSNDLYLLNLTTNGLIPDLIRKRTEEILSINPCNMVVVVSLDGTREIHDKIRGIQGSWDKVIETYRLLKDLSKINNNFQSFLGMTLSSLNLGKFEETYYSVKEIIPEVTPNDFHVNLCHYSSHYYSNLNISNLTGSESKILEDIEKVIYLRHKNFNPISFLEESYLKLAKQFVKTNKTPLNCKAIDTSCFIDSFGNVFPCTIFDKKLGNLRDNDYNLIKILNSETANKIKKEVKELKCPNCWTPCEAYQMVLGDFKNFLRSNL